MKQGRLILHTRSYNATMGNEARKTMFTQGITMQQWVIKQGRLIVH
ncbi:hypothetical protein KSS87_001313, partial [Heliosperma pusillum]